jgi:hypothetical protein
MLYLEKARAMPSNAAVIDHIAIDYLKYGQSKLMCVMSVKYTG